jgi:hypothetical protein
MFSRAWSKISAIVSKMFLKCSDVGDAELCTSALLVKKWPLDEQ